MSMLETLQSLLVQGATGTQEEISELLRSKGLDVTQSTVSRALRKLGAVRTTSATGTPVYYMPEALVKSKVSNSSSFTSMNVASLIRQDFRKDSADTSVRELLRNIQSNGSLIVIHTAPGSASLIAHILDTQKPANILGTIAGDDTIFVAPASAESIETAISSIRALLSSA